MNTKNKEYFETALVIATIIILIVNMIALFGSGMAILGILNTLVFVGYVTFIIIDRLH